MIKELIKGHKFFMKNSGPYLGGWTYKNILRLPFTYTKYMYWCIQDILNSRKTK